MSLHVFCPFAGCAAKVAYDAVKPTRCPRCSKLFADAFRVAVPQTAPISRAAVVEADLSDDQPITRKLAKAAVAKVGPRLQRDTPAPISRIMNAPPDLVTEAVFPDDGLDDIEEEDADPRAIRRRARELAASIDPSTITIGDQDEGVFKFDSFWAEGQSAREKAAKKPAKRSRR